MGKLIVKAIVLVAAITSAAGGRAGEPRPEIPAYRVLQEFVVVKGRGDLLVPVRIGEMDHFFVIDTGASYTVLDTSLCGGDPERAKTGSSGGSARAACSQCPKGAATNQPRATPWGEEFEAIISPERAVQFSKTASALRTRFRSPRIAFNQRFAWK